MDNLETAWRMLSQISDRAAAINAIQLGYISGAFMIMGYWLYIRHALVDGFDPNPSTWLMFAYGTALLTVLEFDKDAAWHLLLTPIACSVLSIWVALICWRRGKIRWPDRWEDRSAFILDIVLTIAYVSAWVIATYGLIETFTETDRENAAFFFLIFSNMTTLTAFAPLIISSFKNPGEEYAPAWTVWTLSYITLGIATYVDEGTVLTELMIYPALCTVLHGLTAWLGRRSMRYAAS
jgi:hypothetical protein